MQLEEIEIGMRVKVNVYSSSVWVVESIAKRLATIVKEDGSKSQVIDIILLDKEN